MYRFKKLVFLFLMRYNILIAQVSTVIYYVYPTRGTAKEVLLFINLFYDRTTRIYKYERV